MHTLGDSTLLAHTSGIVLDRLGDGFLFGLPWPEQVVAIVYGAQGLIDHGGFRHFFANNWPDNPPYSVFADAYRDIGAVEAAECIEAAASLFPFSDPHRDRDGRRAVLKESCTDKSSPLVRLGDRVAAQSHSILALLAAYIRRHSDEIFHATT